MRLAALMLFLLAESAPASVRLPSYTRQVLSNGVVLDILPRHDVPLVTIRVLIRGGVESEPAKLSGLSSVTAEALRRGTQTRSAEQFSSDLDQLGATLVTIASMQTTSVSFDGLSKDFEKGLDLVTDALLHPTFPEPEIARLISQRTDAVKALKDNPGAAASEYFRSFFFGTQHPYGRPADERTLPSITRADVAAYHKSMYTGRNMIFIVAGDIEAAAVASSVTNRLSSFPAGSLYQWKKATLPPGKSARVAFVDKSDATETQFRIGMPGIDRTSPDRVPLWVVNTLFGGRFTSILNDALRVSSGLTYGAQSYVEQNYQQGRITISSFTGVENTVKAVDMALSLIDTTPARGITADQLASAKAYLKGTYPSEHLETADQIADLIGELEIYGLNRGEIDDLFSRIDAVTLDQANAVAKKYLKREGLTILLLGNSAKFAKEAIKYNPEPLRTSITQAGLQIGQ